MMRGAGIALGLLGVLFSISASAFALLIYGATHGRAGYGIAAFVLALLIGVGAALLPARPDIGAALMVLSSITGTISISALNSNTWYAVAIPLSVLGAFLGLWVARPTPSIIALRWVTLALLVAGVVVGYIFGGLFGAVAFFVPLLIAAAIVLIGSTSSSPSSQG
jgi:hypothetical protein